MRNEGKGLLIYDSNFGMEVDKVKILIIQTAFIGDVILATPLVEQLKDKFPESSIDFLLRKGNESLLHGHPKLNKVWVWNKKRQKYKGLWKLVGQIKYQCYDYVFNLQRFASSGFLTTFSGAKYKIGFNKNPFAFGFSHKVSHNLDGNLHEVQRNLQLLNCLGVAISPKASDYRPKLYPSKSDFETTESFKQRAYICIAPASVWFTKQLPQHKWVEFIQQLPKDLTIYVLGAKGDRRLANSIEKNCPEHECHNLAGQLTLLQSAALIQDATLTYTNDSAPMHLASAMNAPVAAVFCSTVPAFGFGPLSDQSYVIETSKQLSCRPCGLHGKKRCSIGDFTCAESINTSTMVRCLSKS